MTPTLNSRGTRSTDPSDDEIESEETRLELAQKVVPLMRPGRCECPCPRCSDDYYPVSDRDHCESKKRGCQVW